MASDCPPGKARWPELVGANGEEAAKHIEMENTNVNAIVVPEGNSVIMDERCDRVWVWVNEAGIVKEIPKIG